ncbi:hypothetical protein OCL06_03550 [Alteromonas sp. ASW11-19]|uniref:Uncharacterized protein n=1 Tax=Alteromonas salexigens TaxID=2982530 RepID=A0ABT2VK72_9ALTE|nr:DUF6689 family protein [Alteromonas salexigens]MCU7553671.1 hypothetical protein [Alteromonas salexigens]
MKVSFLRTLVACAVLAAPIAQAQVVSPATLTIADNTVQAKIDLGQSIAVDVTLEFDNTVGLNANTVDITAELLSPASLAIQNRLPTSLISAPAAFPVMVSIEPKTDKGFAFEGVATVELYTKNLHYVAGTPLRLFRSHADGTFEDITQLTSSGSFRARGNTGSFSDFIIMADTRPQNEVLATKYALLDDLVSNNRSRIDSVVLTALDSGLNSLYSALQASDYTAASTAVDTLITTTETASGAQMDDVWRSSDDIVNVKGELLTRLYTLRYSLRTL